MRRAILITVLALILVIPVLLVRAAIPPAGPFQVNWDTNTIKLSTGEKFYLDVTIRVPDEYYIYAEDTEVDFASLEGLIIKDIDYPMPEKHEDQYVGKMVEVYTGDVNIGIAGEVPEGLDPGERELVAKVRFKGCSDKICFRPDERLVTFYIKVAGVPAKAEAPSHPVVQQPKPPDIQEIVVTGFGDLFNIHDFDILLDRGVGLAVLIVFLAGILTSLTPCVWPVIPAILIFVGVHPHKRFWENLLLAAFLTCGLVIVYSILGIVAVAFGRNLGFLFQYKWFLVVVILFFVMMSLSMFGFFDVRLPHRWHQKMHKLGGEGYLGAFLAGMGLGLVASPCAGPVIAALLGYVALQQDYLFGFGLLIVFSMGMGVLFIILGACYGELAIKLRGGRWMIWVRRFLGLVLLLPAAFYFTSLMDWNASKSFERPCVEWLRVQEDALLFASKTGRPVMIEFTADWCPPCKALDSKFFTRDDIVKLTYLLVPLKVDATAESKEVRDVLEKYKVMGMPAIVFLSPKGQIYDDLKVTDYDPRRIEKSMREAIRRAGVK